MSSNDHSSDIHRIMVEIKDMIKDNNKELTMPFNESKYYILNSNNEVLSIIYDKLDSIFDE